MSFTILSLALYTNYIIAYFAHVWLYLAWFLIGASICYATVAYLQLLCQWMVRNGIYFTAFEYYDAPYSHPKTAILILLDRFRYTQRLTVGTWITYMRTSRCIVCSQYFTVRDPNIQPIWQFEVKPTHRFNTSYVPPVTPQFPRDAKYMQIRCFNGDTVSYDRVVHIVYANLTSGLLGLFTRPLFIICFYVFCCCCIGRTKTRHAQPIEADCNMKCDDCCTLEN